MRNLAAKKPAPVVNPLEITRIKPDNSTPSYMLPYGAIAYCGPTHNCQVFSIGGFDCLLNTLKNEQIMTVLEDLTNKHINKYILLIDVSYAWCKRVEGLGYEIISKSPYDSTNGSSMVIYLLKIRENYEDDDE